MNSCNRRGYLKVVLIALGLVFLSLHLLMEVWPSGWMWYPRQHEYEQMMIGVYGTLGVFLLWASRQPEAHLSLLWFTFWSSLVHGTIMGSQAIMDGAEQAHLGGDVAALGLAVALLGWLIPRRVRSPNPLHQGVSTDRFNLSNYPF